eukprot:Gb_22891 [translate_table: standard]
MNYGAKRSFIAMATTQSFRNPKKKAVLCFGPVLQIDDGKRAINVKAGTLKTGTGVRESGNRSSGGEVKMLCTQGRLKEALSIVHVMDHRGIPVDSSIYASLLHGCVNQKNLIGGFAQNGNGEEALTQFYQMQKAGIQPNQFTFASVISACANLAAIDRGYAQNGHVEEASIFFQKMPERNVVSWTAMIAGYAQNGYVDQALKLFQNMPERNVVSWNAMLAGYVQNGHGEEALNLFRQMQLECTKPNSKTFAIVLPTCANFAALEQGQEVHEIIIRSGFQSDVFVGSALIDMYAKCGTIETARYIFDNLPQRDVVSWNTMIAGYVQIGHFDDALKLFQKMPERDVISWNAIIVGYAQNGNIDEALKLFHKMPERNVVSWTAMIGGYTQIGHLDEALQLFQKMPDRDVISWNVMIAGYAHNGRLHEAVQLFHKMPKRDGVSWNSMIAGYAQNGNAEEALKLFRQMQIAGVQPNSETFIIVLPVCANFAALEQGKEVHEVIIRSGFQFNVFVGSALVDMYAKCGSIENACMLFEQMPQRDTVSWNAMIGGYAIHGCAKEALQLFEQMQQLGTNLDDITFLGVLSACCHAGLVEEGWQCFDCMSQYYCIKPAMEHYCCMVDLLGRAGRLDEAHDFINKMPIKPDASVWMSLLGACRIHMNIELGERVAECLFEMDPKNAAPYVLLSNIYAAVHRWDDVEKARNMMKDRRVDKRPGCSWIEVNKQVYTFVIGDR